MTTIHVFDMDGTIFDTFAATKRAYEEAGLTEYTRSYYGIPAKEWKCPTEIHASKACLFHKYRELIREAWAAPLYRALLPTGAFILTGASTNTVRTCQKVFPDLELRIPFGTGLNILEKQKVLRLFTEKYDYRVFYYDDIPSVGREIVKGLKNATLITESDWQ